MASTRSPSSTTRDWLAPIVSQGKDRSSRAPPSTCPSTSRLATNAMPTPRIVNAPASAQARRATKALSRKATNGARRMSSASGSSGDIGLPSQQVDLVDLHRVAHAVDGDDDRQPQRRLGGGDGDDEHR